jgi:hypothetical protein
MFTIRVNTAIELEFISFLFPEMGPKIAPQMTDLQKKGEYPLQRASGGERQSLLASRWRSSQQHI